MASLRRHICHALSASNQCCLTRRSTGPATAGGVSLARSGFATVARQAYTACLRGPVSSNVRPHNKSNAVRQQISVCWHVLDNEEEPCALLMCPARSVRAPREEGSSRRKRKRLDALTKLLGATLLNRSTALRRQLLSLASSLGRRDQHWPLVQLLRHGGLKSCHATAGSAEREVQAAGQEAKQRRVSRCTCGRGLTTRSSGAPTACHQGPG